MESKKRTCQESKGISKRCGARMVFLKKKLLDHLLRFDIDQALLSKLEDIATWVDLQVRRLFAKLGEKAS